MDAIERFLMDDRINRAARILLAYATGYKADDSLMANALGIPLPEFRRTRKRLADDNLMVAGADGTWLPRLLKPGGAKRNRLRSLAEDLRPSRYPIVYPWRPKLDGLFGHPRLAYLRDLADPAAREWWRYFALHVSRNRVLSASEMRKARPEVRGQLALLGLARYIEGRPEALDGALDAGKVAAKIIERLSSDDLPEVRRLDEVTRLVAEMAAAGEPSVRSEVEWLCNGTSRRPGEVIQFVEPGEGLDAEVVP